MMNLFLIEGKLSMGAGLMASQIKGSGRYDYDVAELSDAACKLVFMEGERILGESAFTIHDAERAGLLKPNSNWTKWPRNMLFARALSNGAKWYTPDVFRGPVYTPDELGAVVDGETGAVVEVPTPAAKIEDLPHEHAQAPPVRTAPLDSTSL